MTGRRRPGRDRGSFTAEFAVGLPAFVLLLLAGVGAVSVAITEARCVDAAREIALAVARGGPVPAAMAPENAEVRVMTDEESVAVTVTARVGVPGTDIRPLTVRAAATAAREPEPVRW